jgi:hypothetical protein
MNEAEKKIRCELPDGWYILQELQNEMHEWHQDRFGDTPREIVIKKLEEEVGELRDSPGDIYEFADVLLCLIEAAKRAGFLAEEVIEFAWHKLEVNRRRSWVPHESGIHNHIPAETNG